MSARIPVLLSSNPYEIIVGNGTLGRTGHFAAQVVSPCHCAVLTDENVSVYYAETVIRSLQKEGFTVTRIVIPAGESSKSMKMAEQVCDQMISGGLDRKSCLFALGGGVIGDLGGFVAAIFYRGIPCIQLPTSVVAQVDSSIGGKTGVNAIGGKNLIGAFHQPVQVITDPETLKTLPKREFNEGIAEIIKHAAIADADLLDETINFRSADLSSLIARNIKIKARIVAADELETKGLRALLNFGHTIGHAIENTAGYGRYLHGEAISIGLVAALDLSVKKAGLSREEANRVLAALRQFELPTTLPADLPTENLMAALKRDKKFVSGAIRFVLVPKLGSAIVSQDVSEEDILATLQELRA